MELPRLLTRILQADGFDVQDPGAVEGRSGATYSVSLVAERDGERRLVDILAFRKARGRDLDALAKITKDTGYDGAVLVALQGREEGVGDQDHETVEVLDRLAVATRLGELLLDDQTPGSGFEAEDAALELLPIRLEERPDAGLSEDDEELAPVPSEQAAEAYSQAAQQAAGDTTNDPVDQAQASPELPEGQAVDPAGPGAAEDLEAAEPDVQDPPVAQADDESDAEWLSEPPSADPEPEEPEPEGPDLDQAPDDGSDAEWLTDPPDGDANEKKGLDGQPATGPDEMELPDDGSDAEWLTEPPDGEANEKKGLDGQPATDPSQIEVPDDGSDAEFLEGSTREKEPEPEGAGQLPPGYQAAEGTSPAKEASDAQWLGDPGPGSSPSGSAEPAPADETEETAGAPAANFLVGGCLPIQIDEAEARRKGQGTLFSVEEAELELLPFHAYTYRCQLTGEGSSQPAEGSVWVSALNGNVVHDPPVDLIYELDVPFSKLEPEHPAAKAETDAHAFLCEELVVREEVRQDFGESSIMERIELSPDPDSVAVEHHGLVYAARWHLVGKNGEVYVDAATGDVLPA